MARLTLTAPLIIGPRLMPAVRVGDDTTGGIISLDPSTLNLYVDRFDGGHNLEGEDGVTVPRLHEDDDTYIRRVFATWLVFLADFAEAYNPRHHPNEHLQEGAGSFPAYLGEWAYLNADEIDMARMELEGDTDE